MPAQHFDITIRISVSIPILGDKSIMLVQPPNNFAFRKVYLDDYVYKSKMTDGHGQVLPDYFYAVNAGEKPFIICLEQSAVRVVQHDKPADALSFLNGTDFDQLIAPIREEIEADVYRFFSLLHLYKEGEIARKHSFYAFSTQDGICTTNRFIDTYIEDIITLILNPMKITGIEVSAINDLLYKHEQAYQMLKTIVIDELEYTYHTLDDTTNYKNLITPLEVMFLRNDYGNKNIMLSKRMAVFLGSTNAEIKSIYNDVKNHYHDRSEAVHEGSITQITHASVDELRALVRKATIKYIGVIEQALSVDPTKSFDEIKANLISHLMGIVQMKNSLGIW